MKFTNDAQNVQKFKRLPINRYCLTLWMQLNSSCRFSSIFYNSNVIFIRTLNKQQNSSECSIKTAIVIYLNNLDCLSYKISISSYTSAATSHSTTHTATPSISSSTWIWMHGRSQSGINSSSKWNAMYQTVLCEIKSYLGDMKPMPKLWFLLVKPLEFTLLPPPAWTRWRHLQTNIPPLSIIILKSTTFKRLKIILRVILNCILRLPQWNIKHKSLKQIKMENLPWKQKSKISEKVSHFSISTRVWPINYLKV